MLLGTRTSKHIYAILPPAITPQCQSNSCVISQVARSKIHELCSRSWWKCTHQNQIVVGFPHAHTHSHARTHARKHACMRAHEHALTNACMRTRERQHTPTKARTRERTPEVAHASTHPPQPVIRILLKISKKRITETSVKKISVKFYWSSVKKVFCVHSKFSHPASVKFFTETVQ